MGPQNLAAASFSAAAAKKSGSSKIRQPQNPAAAKSGDHRNRTTAGTGIISPEVYRLRVASRQRVQEPMATDPHNQIFRQTPPAPKTAPRPNEHGPHTAPFHTAPTTCEFHLASPTPTTLRSPADSPPSPTPFPATASGHETDALRRNTPEMPDPGGLSRIGNRTILG